MSTIEEIIKIEREATSQLEIAKKEAENIKNSAREEAVKILSAAKIECKAQTEDIYNKVDAHTIETEKNTLDQLNKKLNERKIIFSRQCNDVANWIVEQIIG
ncbi:MAG: hypothetical protein DRI44_07605 [Chlamydiae bacterium]|nr:MAG: hypothetical protein DRI44_07605 [Chlamydiota bacterium]